MILASNNKKKIIELNQILENLRLRAVPQGGLGISDAEETGLSFVENALIKARHAAKLGGQSAVADDSGLCVPALGGAPGIYSARYGGGHGNDAGNNDKLLAEMENIDERSAYYVCVIAYVHHADDPLPLIAQGLWHGEILREARGTGGFGYDPLFYIPDIQKSAAQLSDAEKNALSHRHKALTDFVAQYRARYL